MLFATAEMGAETSFESVAEAWFWTMDALAARREGVRSGGTKDAVHRPCEPDDVLKCLDGLYRQGRIDLAHARVLRKWAEQGRAPQQRHPAERSDLLLWCEALERLEGPLRRKGIVA